MARGDAATRPGDVGDRAVDAAPRRDGRRPHGPGRSAARRVGVQQTLRQPDSEQAFYVDGTATFRRTFGPEGGGLPADHVDAYAEVLDGPEAMRTALDWYRANPLPPPTQMGPVRVPALYVWGTDDRAFTRSSAERTADFVEGPYTYVELVGEGHWLPERAPDAVLDALLAHLAAVEDGAG